MTHNKVHSPNLRTLARDAIQALLQQLGWRLEKYRAYPIDFEPAQIEIIERVKPFTMTTPERLHALIHAVDYVTDNNIDGAFVECGVWRGGSMMAAALRLLERNAAHRKLMLYDTFEGMTQPQDNDTSNFGENADTMFTQMQRSENTSTWCYASIDDVRANLAQTTYPDAHITYIKGPVEETLPAQLPDRIALLRLDTDWYESTKHELEHLYPLLQPGGVLIIDDYGYWQGARQAVDEYFGERGIKSFLHRVDGSARLMIKAH